MKKTIGAFALLSLALVGCDPVALLTSAAGKAAGASTGSVALKVSAAVGTNANTADFGGSNALFTGQANASSPNVTTLAATTIDLVGGGKTRVVTVTLSSGAKPAAGTNFPIIGTAATPSGSAVTYTEPAVGPNDKIKIWLSTAGNVSVDAVAGQSVSVTLKGCTMSSAPAGSGARNPDNAGTGTFTLDGSMKVDGIKGF